MAKSAEKVLISMTDTRPYRRLVEFVTQVREHADKTGDKELRKMLRELKDDLLEKYE